MADKRVLIVDDEQPVRELCGDAIRSAGWQVDTAAKSAEALELIKDQLYDAAVVDFTLPDMDGVRLHSEIRRVDAELADRTLFMSGDYQAQERLDYFATDGCGFLPKPFRVQDLVDRVRDLLDE